MYLKDHRCDCNNFFVLYGQALILEKLGLDYPVDTYYCIEPFFSTDLLGRHKFEKGDVVSIKDINKSVRNCVVPQWTVDQVLRWFRVIHQIDVQCSFTSFKTWAVHIEDNSENPMFEPIDMVEEFTEHIDAEIEAINMVLSHFIKNNPEMFEDYVDDVFEGETICNCKC